MSQKEQLKNRILDRLVYSVGKDTEHAVPHDWCVALTLAVRDQVVDKWMESTRRSYRQDRKRVYYLSLEFLIGRLLSDTISNLGLTALCREAMAELGQDYERIVNEEPDAALGNGGLGRLAACFMDSMASLGIAGMGYGIRYQHGLFRQRFGEGWQIEEAEDWLTQGGNPWEFDRPEASYHVSFGGTAVTPSDGDPWQPGEQVIACANDMPIAGWGGAHVNTLRLWSAKPAKTFDLSRFNRGEYLQAAQHEVLAETLTRILYPDDSTDSGRELRLKQEYFFTSASAQDLLRRFLTDHDDLGRLPEFTAIQLNDTHPAIMVPELVRLLVDVHGLEFRHAFELTRGCLSYTNHTLLPEALESWPLPLFARVLPRHLQIIHEIDRLVAGEAGAASPAHDHEPLRIVTGDEDNGGAWVRMGNLAFLGSHRVNGVSALHTQLMSETVFDKLHGLYPSRIVSITNGVTPRRWLYHCNPPLAGLVSSAIGDGWVTDLERIEALAPMADDAAFRDAYMRARSENKQRLARQIAARSGIQVSTDAMFDVQIKRVHEYKRQLLNVLEVVAQYQAILDAPNEEWTPQVRIFAGKAAPSYTMAKLIIKLINDVAATVNADPVVGDRLKVVYLPNYNVSLAEIIIPGADVSEQISTAGMEASGTGNMKLGLNGSLTIGTLDGANVEILDRVGAEHMFIFGKTADEVATMRAGGYDAGAAIAAAPALDAALRAIESGRYSDGDEDRYRPIVEHLRGGDYFMVAADFPAYQQARDRLFDAYRSPADWARSAVLNTSLLGWFSSDRAIRDYDREIWHAQPR
ncbi:MAG: glycogen/starch/alpha-glucan phosphorylase [Xanthomonadales bacterium]|nr:glycogen/starch/alpha-glucan phosphorylase [Xanthomonadales bacterium]